MQRVRCHTSGRRASEYEVVLDEEGGVISVSNISIYGNMRTTWTHHSGKPMSLTASCAVRAAYRKLAVEVWSQPMERV